MKRLLVLALGLALTASASACSDITGIGGSVQGTYYLRTVGGQSLPVTVAQSPGYTQEVLSGQLMLDPNGSYLDVTTFRDNYSNAPSTTFEQRTTGSWTLSGNQLRLTDSQGYTSDATIDGRQLVFVDYSSGGSYTLVYAR